MGRKTDIPCYIKFNQLEDEPDSPARTALLLLRSACFNLTAWKIRECDCAKVAELRTIAEKRRGEVLAIGGEMVDLYLPSIDKALELGL